MASVAKKRNFLFYLILINFNSHMWRTATILGSTALVKAPVSHMALQCVNSACVLSCTGVCNFVDMNCYLCSFRERWKEKGIIKALLVCDVESYSFILKQKAQR